MAHGVKSSDALQLHQVLHGYVDGHRQLAASKTLKPRDIKTMLVLSDISGPGARIDEAGYLTGYPLVESGVYALARTWAAPEMPRPGCVWTHTILIDFADLATLTSPQELASLFRRPDKSGFEVYGKVLRFDERQSPPTLSVEAQVWSRRVLAALYGSPRDRIVTVRPNGFAVDSVALAVWAQQWPRLRRAFRFCTLAVAERSIESDVFDLQVLPSADRSVRSRFPGAIDAESAETSTGPWLDSAVEDLTDPNVSGLRAFFRRIGGDVASGREAFASLCRLHQLVHSFGTDPAAAPAAIALLESELGSVQARAGGALVANALFEQAIEPDDVTLTFLLRHLDLIEAHALSKGAERVGRAVWNWEPQRLVSTIETSPSVCMITERVLQVLHVTELIDGLRRVPTLTAVALRYRPEILVEPAFWSHGASEVDEAFSVIAKSHDLQAAAVAAIMTANREDLAERTVREIGSFEMLRVIAAEFAGERCEQHGLDKWIVAATADLPAVAELLVGSPAQSVTFLSAIARLLPPDAVPNDFGTDPWLIASGRATGAIVEGGDLFLKAYLLSRALGPRSRNAAELAQIGFESTYLAAGADRLPEEVWRMLERRLPRSMFWFDWDRCVRIRTAVVDLFVDRDLAPDLFAQIARDDSLFTSLAEVAARSRRGRDFLKRVRRAIKEDSERRFASRISVIDKILD